MQPPIQMAIHFLFVLLLMNLKRAIDSQCHQYSARFDNVAVKPIFCPRRWRRRKQFGALGRIQFVVEVIQLHVVRFLLI
jgi:hypothetical protein